MNVEIWSDVMCPFCYIGKRKFEKALEQFSNRDEVNIIWKSFQLDPNTITNPNLNTIENLRIKKGWSKEQTIETINYVSNIAKQVGLTFNFDEAVVANSFNAHRLSHLAKKHDKQNELEEKLFEAYFTNGENTDDFKILLKIATAVGLAETEIIKVLNSDLFAIEVNEDIKQAQALGVNGVPFFVINKKYSISGAQESEIFLKALNQSYIDNIEYLQIQKSNSAKVCGTEDCDI